MAKLIFIFLFLISLGISGQTFVEMMHPRDADIVLEVVRTAEEADIIVCITKDKKEARTWDCMWRFKSWGFANFSIFLLKSPEDFAKLKEDDTPIFTDGKVYFVIDKEKRGYKSDKTIIGGIMRVKHKFYR